MLRRWTNLHVMRMDAGSTLNDRAMQAALQLPLNHPHFDQEVIEKVCRPNGYIQVSTPYSNTNI
jgi:hypothetical protein